MWNAAFAFRFRFAAIFTLLFTSLLTAYVLWHSGYYEPFYDFQAAQALVQIGFTLSAILLASSIMAWSIGGIAKGKIGTRWIGITVLASIELLLSALCQVGYLMDLRKY